MCAEVAHAIGDERAASYLEPQLAPYTRLHVSVGSGLLHYGTVAYALGLVAAACSRWDAAVAHLERALAAEESMGARLWAARTRLACARALLARGAPGDRSRAARLARTALRAARQQAWHDVTAAGSKLETPLWRTRMPLPPAATRGASKQSES